MSKLDFQALEFEEISSSLTRFWISLFKVLVFGVIPGLALSILYLHGLLASIGIGVFWVLALIGYFHFTSDLVDVKIGKTRLYIQRGSTTRKILIQDVIDVKKKAFSTPTIVTIYFQDGDKTDSVWFFPHTGFFFSRHPDLVHLRKLIEECQN